MNRRSFLQALAAVAAGIALPVKAITEALPRAPAAELAAHLQQVFDCSLGSQWAFVEPRPVWAINAIMVDDDKRWQDLTPYVTIEVEAMEENPADILRAEFDRILAEFPALDGARLYWRYPERFRLSERWYQDKGMCILTQEQYEDAAWKLPARQEAYLTKNNFSELLTLAKWPTPEQDAVMSGQVKDALCTLINDRNDEEAPEGCLGSIETGGIYLPSGDPWRIRKLRTRIAIPKCKELTGRSLRELLKLTTTYSATQEEPEFRIKLGEQHDGLPLP